VINPMIGRKGSPVSALANIAHGGVDFSLSSSWQGLLPPFEIVPQAGERLCVDLTMGRCARRWHRDPLHRCAARRLGPRAWPRCSRCAPAGLGAGSSSPLSPTSLWPPARPHRTDGPGPAMRLDRTARGARWDSRIKRISACSGWVAMGLLPSGSGSCGLWATRNSVLQRLYVRYRTDAKRLRV
jgi:hypothetical protein